MADQTTQTTQTLTVEQVQAILALCNTIKSSGNNAEIVNPNAKMLAAKVEEAFIPGVKIDEDAEDEIASREALIQSAQYAQSRIAEAAVTLDKAKIAVDRAEDALENARDDMQDYYVLKGGNLADAHKKVRKAMVLAGLAMLELDHYKDQNI